MLYACPQCGKRQAERYCEAHKPKPWASSRRRSQLPPRWDKISRAVRERDPVCVYCNSALSTAAHHINDPADHSMSNLAGICDKCHSAITFAERAGRRVG